MGGVHELQLLPGEREEQRQCRQERGQTDRQTDRDHARPLGPGSSPAWLWPLQVCQKGPWHPCLVPIPQPMSNIPLPISCVLIPLLPDQNSEGFTVHPRPFHCPSHILTCLILQPIAYILHPTSCIPHPPPHFPHSTPSI